MQDTYFRWNILIHRDDNNLLVVLPPVLYTFHFSMQNPRHKFPSNEDTQDFLDATIHSYKFLYGFLVLDKSTRTNNSRQLYAIVRSDTGNHSNQNPNAAIRAFVCMNVPPTFDLCDRSIWSACHTFLMRNFSQVLYKNY